MSMSGSWYRSRVAKFGVDIASRAEPATAERRTRGREVPGSKLAGPFGFSLRQGK